MLKDKKTTVKIACIGDSVTYGSKLRNRIKECYPECLQALLGRKYRTMNFGLSGATINPNGDIPYISSIEYKKSLDFKPDLVIMQFGGNDSKKHNYKGTELFKNEYLKLMNSYKLINKDVLFIIILPVPIYHELWGVQTKILNGEITITLEDIILDNNIPFVDPKPSFSNRMELYDVDEIHPNKDGAQILAELVLKEAIKL